MGSLWQDVRYAARVLGQAPGFALAAVGVLALGIGANSAIFSLVDVVLLRPLPFAHPNELVMLYEHPPGYAYNRVAPLNYLDWSEQNHAFASTAAVAGGGRGLGSGNGPTEQVPGQSVTRGFFDVLGVQPIAGRTFTAEDSKPGTRVVVISERLWKARFGEDPKAVGGTVRLDGLPFTVIGVVPAEFQILFRADLWTPFTPIRRPEQRKMHYLQVVGRRKAGVTDEQARADMALIAQNIARISPETNKDWGVTVRPLREALVGRELRVTSLALAGVVGFVLMMACANVANLMLARSAGRSREIAVRASLGGSRGRIFRQLLTESGLLAALGGIVGVVLAWAIVQAAPAFLPAGTLPVGLLLKLDVRVVGFAAGLTLLTGLLFGIAPAMQSRRIPLAEALRAGSRTSTGGHGAFRAVLAAGEIAVAVLLVAGAGLLLRTMTSLNEVDPGYRADHLLTMRVSLPLSRYATPERALAFYEAAEREISAIPGARSVALGGSLPLDGWDIGQGFEIVGDPSNGEANQQSAHYQMVGANYFETLGIPILRGRAFTEHDSAGGAPVCIVNEEFVRRYMKGREPIGMRVSVQAMAPAGPTPVIREVVGVSHQVKVDGLGETENSVEIYVPIEQNPWFWASVSVRATGDPMALAPAVKAAIARVDKDQPVTQMRTMEQIAAGSVAQPRFRAELVGVFAGLAILLASVGIFGVLAFSVSQRTREFGVRMALGARPGDVLKLVMQGGLKITIAGIVIGLGAAAALTRSLESLLFGVKALDPITFVAAPAMLALVALIACAAPAMKASRVDPAVALRQE